jgi:hypothetical protein
MCALNGYFEEGVYLGYGHYNEKGRGTLSGMRAEWVNIASDEESYPLKGHKINSQSDEN